MLCLPLQAQYSVIKIIAFAALHAFVSYARCNTEHCALGDGRKEAHLAEFDVISNFVAFVDVND
jgi:hypothetical protein